MRAVEAPGSYKRFFGSSFLSDVTLIICCESAASDAASGHYTKALQGPAGDQEPSTPDNGLSPKSAAAAAASSHAQAAVAAAAAAVVADAEAADGPCSGQPHPGPAEVLPHSPAPAGVPGTSLSTLQSPVVPAPLQQAFGEAAAAGALCASAALTTTATTSSSSGMKLGQMQGGHTGASIAADTVDGCALPSPAGIGTNSRRRQSRSSSVDTSPVITMPVHGVVLAAASPYFETLLRGWASNDAPLQMVVGEDQLAAAQQLLSYIYTGTLTPGLPQADLLQLLLLADRFDVSRALAAARRALAGVSAECFEWSSLVGVWGLPQHLFDGEAEEAAALRGVAWERLLQLFGNLEDAWASADGRSMWQQLPWRAVSALVLSDALAVASENTTFAAVSSWIAHQQHTAALLQQQTTPSCPQPPRPSHFELQLLAASIRIPALGPTYLSYVALQQDWFAAAVDITSLARAAAFAAAAPAVRKDLIDHTATTTAAAMAAAAAAAAPGHQGCCHGGGCGSSGAATAAAGVDCIGSSLGPWGPVGACQHGSSAAAAAAGGGCSGECGSSAVERRVQLLSLMQAMQRPRSKACKDAVQFSWRVDLPAVRQLYEDVAAAGSRDSRILRSPVHSFAGYEWALQLEVTQTRGATGFDVSKPWSLGVFLTCQVRLEQPPQHSSNSSSEDQQQRQQQQPSLPAAANSSQQQAACGSTAAAGAGAASGDTGRRLSSSSSGSSGGGYFGSSCSGSSDGSRLPSRLGSTAAAAPTTTQQQQQQQPQQMVMQLVDFGFVSTRATIAVREAGSHTTNKRTEKSWEHAVVRYRASWGWPNYLDAQAVGWDDALFARWLIDGQLHLSAKVEVLG